LHTEEDSDKKLKHFYFDHRQTEKLNENKIFDENMKEKPNDVSMAEP